MQWYERRKEEVVDDTLCADAHEEDDAGVPLFVVVSFRSLVFACVFACLVLREV
jgi:hypothetical protein